VRGLAVGVPVRVEVKVGAEADEGGRVHKQRAFTQIRRVLTTRESKKKETQPTYQV
jgi:hypothetical protein